VVFFAIGFETTMPSTALAVLQAEREGIENFSVLGRKDFVFRRIAITCWQGAPGVKTARSGALKRAPASPHPVADGDGANQPHCVIIGSKIAQARSPDAAILQASLRRIDESLSLGSPPLDPSAASVWAKPASSSAGSAPRRSLPDDRADARKAFRDRSSPGVAPPLP
jgi:hypothetical protein